MNSKRAVISSQHPSGHFSTERTRPRIVYSRDDGVGGSTPVSEAARLIIVEDDFLVALVMEAALRQAGFNIAGVANSAEEALKLAEEHRPALAVMDIRLTGSRDGIDAALELFATYGIRCLFATAHQDDATRARAQAANPLGWVAKPYTMASLVAAVQRSIAELKKKEEEDN
jgi:DNA-binding NarL/FixJ family response regulator